MLSSGENRSQIAHLIRAVAFLHFLILHFTTNIAQQFLTILFNTPGAHFTPSRTLMRPADTLSLNSRRVFTISPNALLPDGP